VFCLIVGGTKGNSKLEINFNGNLNKLKESGGNLLAVGDEFVIKDVSFGTVDGDLLIEDGDFGTVDGDLLIEDGDFEIEDGDFITEDGDFVAEDGDFEAVDGDFVTDNDDGSLKTQGDIGSDSG